MPITRVDSFAFKEFQVVLGKDGSDFVAVGYDKDRMELARSAKGPKEDVLAEVKGTLLKLSNEFVDLPGAINLFHRAFHQGFSDPFYFFDERDYKVATHEKARVWLSKEAMDAAIAEGRYADLGKAASKLLNNLVNQHEAMDLHDALKSPAVAIEFATLLRELLHGEDFDGAFDALSALLKPFNAAKWPLLTFWPFALHPTEHGFLKPTPVTRCAELMGHPFAYEQVPSARVYRDFMGFMGWLRDGVASMQPRDFIDLQTFVYAVGSEGFIAGSNEARAKWEAAKAKV